MEIITSPNNNLIKYIKSLPDRKGREKNGEFIIEGLRFSNEAIISADNKAGRGNYYEITRVIMSEEFYNNSYNSGVLVPDIFKYEKIVVADKLFKEISETENPQGIMLTVRMPDITVDREVFSEIVRNSGDKILILDTLQDPGNMGTVIRTADAFGIDLILISQGSVDIYNPKVLRATMGSIFHIPIYRIGEDLKNVVPVLKNAGCKVFVSHLGGERFSGNGAIKGKTALIIGNEANGVSDDISRMADYLIKIPMPGGAESLNASVAAGILMYELYVNDLNNLN